MYLLFNISSLVWVAMQACITAQYKTFSSFKKELKSYLDSYFGSDNMNINYV